MARPVESPCVDICRFDVTTKLCLGCARTEREIERWRQMSARERQAILRLLPARRRRLGAT